MARKTKINRGGQWAFSISLRWAGHPDAWPKAMFTHRSGLATLDEAKAEGIAAGHRLWGEEATVTADGPFHLHGLPLRRA